MDRIRLLGRIAYQIGWATTELAVALYDLATRRDPNAEARRFMDTHPGVTFYRIEEQP